MKQRMRYVFVLAFAASSIALSACSGDDDDSTSNGGSAGASGSKTGGSSTGGKAGNNSGGKAISTGGAGGDTDGGTAGATEAGAGGDSAGAGGNVVGGAAGAGGADTMGGAAGAGGAGELVYACGSATLIQKKCSALVAANCDIATDCSDCVTLATSDREDFQTDPPCDTCNAKWDAFNQCQVDAFESGNLEYGVECVDGYGADGSANCYPFLDDAIACQGYVGNDQDPHECPATWPPQ